MTKTFSKSDLARIIAQRLGLHIGTTQEALEAAFDEIKAHAEAGERVNIGSFGSFVVKTRAARTARNPHTGEPVEVPEKRVLTFRPAKPKA